MRPLGNTTPSNPLDDKSDNAMLANQGRGKPMRKSPEVAGKGAKATKGAKVSGGGKIKGGKL